MICEGVCIRPYFSPTLLKYILDSGMMKNHWHNAETSVWMFFVYLLQHHVKVLPLNLLSELAESAQYKVFAYSYIMCNLLCSSWTRLSKL